MEMIIPWATQYETLLGICNFIFVDFVLLPSYFQKLYNNQQLKRVSKENVEVIQHQIVKDYKLLAWDSDHLTEEYLEMGKTRPENLLA